MNVKLKLKKLAKEFDLKFDTKYSYKYLVCPAREITIRNFLCGCPDPLYISHGNKLKRNRPKVLKKFLLSKDGKNDIKGPHGCVISKGDLKDEIGIVDKIEDRALRKETKKLYNRIKKKMGKSKRLTLIWKPKKKEKNIFNEILLHEFIHELMNENRLRPKSWKWNEGLVTYLTNFLLGSLKRFEKKALVGKDKMWSIYARYTYKWAKLFKGIEDPKQRKYTIVKKIKQADNV